MHGESAAVDADAIRVKTRLGFDESESLLQRMLEAGWVGRLNPRPAAPRPVAPAHQVGRQQSGQPDLERWVVVGQYRG